MISTMTRPWAEVSALLERVLTDPEVHAEVVNEVRAVIRDHWGRDASDVAAQIRTLMTAAVNAIADRRGPTPSELTFVDDMATSRAGQGIPLDLILTAVHVAGRRIWSRIRALAERGGLDHAQVLDARDLYDDWLHEVRHRLIVAYRGIHPGTEDADRDIELLRRLLAGGTAATLAATAADLPRDGGLWALVIPICEGMDDLIELIGSSTRGLFGHDGGEWLAVVDQLPPEEVIAKTVVGAAGPGSAADVGTLRRQAGAAARAAQAIGLSGLIHAAEVATLSALHDRTDLATLLAHRLGPAMAAVGRTADATALTVKVWLEQGKDADRAARMLLVHPNTVRNRVQSLVSASGVDPSDTFQAVDLWWFCSTWLTRGV